MAERLQQVQGHLSNTFPSGLVAGQTAIVTGAGQGIGAETALLFAKEGAKVVVADLDGAKAAEVVRLIRATGGEAVAVAGDIMAKETIEKVINAAAELGGGKIHCIVNNVYFLFPFLSLPAFSCVLRKGGEGEVIGEKGRGG